jgi:uncharacterized protein (DUF2237 family)
MSSSNDPGLQPKKNNAIFLFIRQMLVLAILALSFSNVGSFNLRFPLIRTSCIRSTQCMRYVACSLEEDFSSAVSKALPRNVLGTSLNYCCIEPYTGFFRDGFCKAAPPDTGCHVVNGRFSPAERHICAQVTDEFLAFTLSRGNDLLTPQPIFGFPGLKDGDRWCIWYVPP